MNQDLKDIVESLNFIKDYMVTHMATKEEVAELRRDMNVRFESMQKNTDHRFDEMHAELSSIRSELVDIRHRLTMLEERVGNIEGYRKEIDYALEKIRVLEIQVTSLAKQLAAKKVTQNK